jgi:hypothetical protein
MRRRISHWTAQGFIWYLGKVDERRLRAAAPQTVPSLRNDSILSDKLLAMEHKASIQDIVMKKCPVARMRSPITSLLSACRTMKTLPRQEKRTKLQGVSALYNKATCFEFHQLLVATLLSYGKALDDFATLRKRKQSDLQQLTARADELWTCTSLLWGIAYSRILGNHLEILRQNGWLGTPRNADYHIYSDFTHFDCNDQTITMLPDDEEEGGIETAEIDALSAGDRPFGVAEEDGDDGDGGDDEDGGDVGKEINASSTGTKLVGLADLYQQWIRLQVDRWQANRKITTLLARSPTSVDLNLLAIRYIPPRPAASVMDPWSSTISNLCKTAGIDPGPVLVTLNKRIAKELDKNLQQRPCNHIFSQFDPNPKRPIQYSARVHCEAALAALLKYPYDTLRMHLEV